MPLAREIPDWAKPKPKPARAPHDCEPVPGEFGRYYVKSRSAAKKGEDESYIVDVLERDQRNDGELVVGTCACKGYSVRRTCSHLVDATAIHREQHPEKKD